MLISLISLLFALVSALESCNEMPLKDGEIFPGQTYVDQGMLWMKHLLVTQSLSILSLCLFDSDYPKASQCFELTLETQKHQMQPNARALNVVEKLNRILTLVDQPIDSITIESSESILYSSSKAPSSIPNSGSFDLFDVIETPLVAMIGVWFDGLQSLDDLYIPMDFIEQHSVVDSATEKSIFTVVFALISGEGGFHTADELSQWSSYPALQLIASQVPTLFVTGPEMRLLRQGEPSPVNEYLDSVTNVIYVNGRQRRIDWLLWRYHADEIVLNNLLQREKISFKTLPPVDLTPLLQQAVKEDL